MTTELEQKFFKVFGIEPKIIDACKITDEYWNNEELADKYGCFALYMREKCPYNEDCNDNCEYTFEKIEYPEITDRKLLELICIFSQHCNFGRWNKYAMHSIYEFEYIMLSQLIEYQNKRYTYGIKEKIQQLFKEGE